TLAFRPEQCILVFDDLDLPIGSVRTRLSGGSGGHKGVASILEAFQTDTFRRVKVGVAQPGSGRQPPEHLLTVLEGRSRAAGDAAVSVAQARTLEMVAESAKPPSPKRVGANPRAASGMP